MHHLLLISIKITIILNNFKSGIDAYAYFPTPITLHI